MRNKGQTYTRRAKHFKSVKHVLGLSSGSPIFVFLTFLGRPVYKLLSILVVSSLTIFLFAGHLVLALSKLRPHITLPRLHLPRLRFPRPSLPKTKLDFEIRSKIQDLTSKIWLPQLPPPPVFPRLQKLTFLTNQKLQVAFSIIFVVSTLSIGFYLWILKDLPSPTRLTSNPPRQTTQIFDRNGTLLYQIYDSENRTNIKLSDIPMSVRQATISIEDADFYRHQGFSLRGILRALERNLTSDSVEGGSTITQQLIKNTLLTSEKSLTRKVKEILLSIQTELIYNKDEILEMYLNTVPYGGTSYGIETAAEQYFGKHASELSLSEAALLAGLPQAPTRYSPFGENPAFAKSRQKDVLNKMVSNGYITPSQAQEAESAPLKYASPATAIKAPHFVMFVRDLLVRQLGEEVVLRGGLQVYTTLDLPTQEIAQKNINAELSRLGGYHVSNAAILITKPNTGEILSMVGSKDYFDVDHDGQVNLTTSLRQPGSAIKPITYSLAFEKGYTPSTLIDDSPVSFSTPGYPTWIPKNYDGRFHGMVTLRTALGSSYNIPAIKLLATNGIFQMAQLAQNMGITTWTDPSRFGLSLTLGGVEVKMTDLAEAYGVFANSGRHVKLNPILSVLDSNRHPIPISPCVSGEDCSPKQVLSSQTAYLISDILADNNARTPAFGARSVLNLGDQYQVSVKTGTSNDLRDNWTIGYTPDRLVAVWVGNNDNSPMSAIASGITGASPIWAHTFTNLIALSPPLPFVTPSNLVKVAICTLTNTLACPACPSVKNEVFTNGTQPKSTCSEEQIKQILSSRPTPTPLVSPKPRAQVEVIDKILTGLSTSR